MIKSDAPRSRQRIDQVEGRKEDSLQAEVAAIGIPRQAEAFDQKRILEIFFCTGYSSDEMTTGCF